MSAHEPDWMQRFDATLLRRMNSPGWRDSLTLYVTDDHGGAWSRNLAREGATTEPALTTTTPFPPLIVPSHHTHPHGAPTNILS